VGRLLRTRGLLDRKDQLLVISPFIRTLRTAVELFGQKQWTVPTVISPLCAEHTFARSHFQQGTTVNFSMRFFFFIGFHFLGFFLSLFFISFFFPISFRFLFFLFSFFFLL
jgi:hypothetical protein